MHLGRVITSPRCTVGRVNPSSSAFYQSKGRVDGSLDEPMPGRLTFRLSKYGMAGVIHGRRVLILNLSNRYDYNAAGSSQKCEKIQTLLDRFSREITRWNILMCLILWRDISLMECPGLRLTALESLAIKSIEHGIKLLNEQGSFFSCLWYSFPNLSNLPYSIGLTSLTNCDKSKTTRAWVTAIFGSYGSS